MNLIAKYVINTWTTATFNNYFQLFTTTLTPLTLHSRLKHHHRLNQGVCDEEIDLSFGRCCSSQWF
jgi:hypothetical protein